MKNNPAAFLSIPNRQSFVAILLILLRFALRTARQLWPLLLIFLFNPKKQTDSFFLATFILIALVVALLSILAFFKFYYYVKDDELVIEKGIIRKIKINVPIDRIQTVNFKQSLLHQFFDVVSIEIDTAGSIGHEFSISAIGKKKAEALRNYVESQKRDIEAAQGFVDDSIVAELPSQELLLQLSPFDLLKIGISQNHLRTAGLIMAFFWGFLDDIEDALNIDLFKSLDQRLADNNADWFFLLVLGIPFFLLVSFVLTLINTVLLHYDLKFWKTETGFKIVSGLFTKKERSATLPKIQLIKWDTNPVKQLFEIFSVRLLQAASTAVSRRQSINIPGCYESHLAAVRQAYFPEEGELDFEEGRISKIICWRQVLYLGVLPTALMVLLTLRMLGPSAFWWLLILPLAYFLSLRYQRNWRFYLSEKGLRTNSGIFTIQSVLLQWYKVQAVEVRQSIYQRRKDLANLILYTAAGAVRIPYIKIEKAQEIQNFVLYKIEEDKRSWM